MKIAKNIPLGCPVNTSTTSQVKLCMHIKFLQCEHIPLLIDYSGGAYPPADWLFWGYKWCIPPCCEHIQSIRMVTADWLFLFSCESHLYWLAALTLSITNPPCIQSNHIKCSCFVYPVNNFFARPFCHVNDDDLIMISANGWIHMMRRTCCRLSSPTTSVSYSCRWPSSTSPFARCCSWCHRMQGWSLRLFLYTSLCCFRCCECG